MKCLFIVSDFDIGGITSSLENITKELISRGHEVSILNLPKVDSLPTGFDKRINLINLDNRSKFWDFGIHSICGKNFIVKCGGLFIGLIKKILNKMNLWNKYVFAKLNIVDKYDISIGFRQGPVEYFVAKYKVNADIHAGFWHGDIEYMGDISSWDSYILKMDIIAGVSNATCEGLLRHYPSLEGKLKTVYNIFDVDTIRANSEKEIGLYEPKVFNIVTVSRVEFYQKNIHIIPKICTLLLQDNIEFHWTIVGDGPDFKKLQEMIVNDNLMDVISLVGNKSNPYPYIKEADLFVLTSICESYGMVVMESLILGTPVVAGEYPALKEILPDKCGIRAENSIYSIYSAIKKIITDEVFYKEIKENALKFNYSSDETYKQFLGLFGDKYA